MKSSEKCIKRRRAAQSMEAKWERCDFYPSWEIEHGLLPPKTPRNASSQS